MTLLMRAINMFMPVPLYFVATVAMHRGHLAWWMLLVALCARDPTISWVNTTE